MTRLRSLRPKILILAFACLIAGGLTSLRYLGDYHAYAAGPAAAGVAQDAGVAPPDTAASIPVVTAPIVRGVVVDPIADSQTGVESTWSTLETYGPLWGGALLLFAGVGAFLRRNAIAHWLAQGRVLAVITTASMMLGAVLTWRFRGGDTAGLLMSLYAAIAALIHPTVTTPAPAGGPTSPDATTTAKLAMTPAPAAAPGKTSQSGRAGLAVMLLLALGAAIGLGAMSGCTQTTRQDTIHATLVAADAARDGLIAYDQVHEQALVAAAADLTDGKAKLAAYRAARARVVAGLEGAYRALVVAALSNDDLSLSNAQAIAAQFIAAIQSFITAGGK